MISPLRRFHGITYWVIEDPAGIYDFINAEIRKEWEADARSDGRDPQSDPWLQTLSKRRWLLEIREINEIRLNPEIVNYVDSRTDYGFARSLAKRSEELRKTMEEFGNVIWPLIVKEEDMQLVDGYCRYSTLKAMNVLEIYTYLGTI